MQGRLLHENISCPLLTSGVKVYPRSKPKVTEILMGYGYKLYDAGIDHGRRESLHFAAYNTIAYPFCVEKSLMTTKK
jgi:hypothetical protein